MTPSPTPGPRVCPNCGLLVAGDAVSCQCGQTFRPVGQPGSAAEQLHEAQEIFGVGHVLAIAWKGLTELKGGIVGWMVMAGVLQILPASLVNPDPEHMTPKDMGVMLVATLVSAFGGYSLVRAALLALRGTPTSFWRARISLAAFFNILLTIVVMVVPVLIGLLLFVAPGVYLLLMWSQAVLLIIDGRAKNVDALRASDQLTKGARFEILLVSLVPVLIALPGRIVELMVPVGGSPLTPGFALFLVSTLWQMLALTFGTWVSAVMYQLLLNRRRP